MHLFKHRKEKAMPTFNDTVKLSDKKGVRMIAHRGVSGIERENTCPAFVAAGNRSYYGVETDVHCTADGKFVIIHDADLKRVSGGEVSHNVEESDYGAVADVVLPDLDGSRVRRDIRVPQLAEYISICKKYDKYCVLEIKGGFKDEDIKRMIAEIIELDYLDRMIFISFSLYYCKLIRELLPNAKVQYLTSQEIDDKLIDLLLNCRLDLDIAHTHLTKENVERLHHYGIEVNCWTVDLVEYAEPLIEMGVDYITSDILE